MSFGFVFYDLTLMVIFLIALTIFLIVKKKNLSREGIMFLYKTQVGVNIIKYLGDKYKRTLKFLGYISVSLGYVLMVSITYLIINSVYVYIKYPAIRELSPPVTLLIPYFPEIFGLQKFFPGFYAIDFFIAIAIVALVHEGAHGVFARLNNVRIKSTGFGFLGPLLAFFVEQDDKQMQKRRIFPQLTILSAGVFANIITAILFTFLLIGFFNVSYQPYGVEMGGYPEVSANVSTLLSLQNSTFITNEIITLNNTNQTKLIKIIIQNNSYFAPEIFAQLNLSNQKPGVVIKFYLDEPSLRAGMKGTILRIDNWKTRTPRELRGVLDKYDVRDRVLIYTDYNNQIIEYSIVLGASYANSSYPVIGVGFSQENKMNIFRLIEQFFKEEGTVYRANFNPMIADMIYYLLGWIILINFFVAVFNMLPGGPFDGGRFFYLTLIAITKNEKVSERIYKIINIIIVGILLLFLLYMFYWLANKWI